MVGGLGAGDSVTSRVACLVSHSGVEAAGDATELGTIDSALTVTVASCAPDGIQTPTEH